MRWVRPEEKFHFMGPASTRRYRTINEMGLKDLLASTEELDRLIPATIFSGGNFGAFHFRMKEKDDITLILEVFE